MRKLSTVPTKTPCPNEDGCLTRRAILATIAGAALTACSSSSSDPGTPDSGTTGDSDAGVDSATGGGTDSGIDAGGGDAGEIDSGDDSGDSGVCGSGATDAGSVASYAVGTWTAKAMFIIGRDANGLFAFSRICTHNGCTVGAPSATGATECPCHGATFDGNGAVTGGPAPVPLPHFAVAVCDGTVFVDTKKTVPATTRTPA